MVNNGLAALVGTAPESLSRPLNEFKQDGLIALNQHTSQVLEPDKLRRPTGRRLLKQKPKNHGSRRLPKIRNRLV
ncbi:hypothetical protein ABIB44_000076 [Hymenobacter sp. UYCo722]